MIRELSDYLELPDGVLVPLPYDDPEAMGRLLGRYLPAEQRDALCVYLLRRMIERIPEDVRPGVMQLLAVTASSSEKPPPDTRAGASH